MNRPFKFLLSVEGIRADILKLEDDIGNGGNLSKQYEVAFYSLDMILAIGFRVRSKRGTQFRIWANRNLKEYMIKGYVMDEERLKNPDGRPDYIDSSTYHFTLYHTIPLQKSHQYTLLPAKPGQL